LKIVSRTASGDNVGSSNVVVFNSTGEGFQITQTLADGSSCTAPAKFVFVSDNGVKSAWAQHSNPDGTLSYPSYANQILDSARSPVSTDRKPIRSSPGVCDCMVPWQPWRWSCWAVCCRFILFPGSGRSSSEQRLDHAGRLERAGAHRLPAVLRQRRQRAPGREPGALDHRARVAVEPADTPATSTGAPRASANPRPATPVATRCR
jgi:hypothetical protein